jgi:hypothetical protein
MNAPRDKIRFSIVLEGERGNDNPHVHALRFILKHLLRARSLKCVDAREVPAPDSEEAQS